MIKEHLGKVGLGTGIAASLADYATKVSEPYFKGLEKPLSEHIGYGLEKIIVLDPSHTLWSISKAANELIYNDPTCDISVGIGSGAHPIPGSLPIQLALPLAGFVIGKYLELKYQPK
jgi:hypothetical protein